MKSTVLLVQGSGQLAAQNPNIFQEMKAKHKNFIKGLIEQGEVGVVQFSHKIDHQFDFSSDFKDVLSTFDKQPSAGGSNIEIAVDSAMELLKNRSGAKTIYVTGGCLHQSHLLKAAIEKTKEQNIEFILLKDFILQPFFETKYGFPVSIL